MGLLLYKERPVFQDHTKGQEGERKEEDRRNIIQQSDRQTEGLGQVGPLNNPYVLCPTATATGCLGTWPDGLLDMSHLDVGFLLTTQK